MKLLSLGSCNLNIPLTFQRNLGRMSFVLQEHGIPPPVILTLGEAIQAVEHYLGTNPIPAELREYCEVAERDIEASAFRRAVNAAEFALLEPNTSVSLEFRGFYLNRTIVNNEILKPLEAYGDDAIKAARSWFNAGIIRGNNDARTTAAQRLLAFMEPGLHHSDLHAAIIAEARPLKHGGKKVTDQMQTLKCLLDLPMGVVTYNHQYLPDGRPIPWPPEFVEETILAAKSLGLPYMEPSRLVMQHGVTNSMKPDRVHYTPEFEPIIGLAFCDFAEQCLNSTRPAVSRASAEV